MEAGFTVIGLGRVVRKFEQAPDRARQSIVREMFRQMILSARHVKENKLSGQVLHVRTGALRASVTQGVDVSSAEIAGWFGVPAGPTAVYGRAHELGFSGIVLVGAHTRSLTHVFGRALGAPIEVEVEPHSRRMDLPVRSFLRTTLEEMRAQYVVALTAAVTRGFE